MSFIAELQSALGADASIITDESITISYAKDQAPFADFAAPAAVLVARSVDEVSKALSIANSHGIAVVARGAGTGLSGGANAPAGSLVIALEKMNQIIELDEKNLTATAQAGVINLDLDKAAAEKGLAYLPDPASREWSTIGGNAATNAGGMCCVKYGVTSQHIRSLKVVLADGSVIQVGSKTKKGVAGLDLARLFIGSEGTLGIIVEVTVSLVPRPPKPSTLIATFPTIKQAASASIGLLTFSPSMLEIVDQTTIKAVEHWHALGFETVGSILLMQSDDKSTDLDKAQALCESHGAIDCFYSDNPADADDLIRVRKLAYPAFERMGVALLDDIAVPMTEIANIVEEVESIAKKFDVTIGIFGHAGDGNLHPTIVHPHGDDAAAKRALDAFHAIVSAAQARGGTATGEHGVGALKVDLVKNELSHEVRELQRGIKNLFDPKGILNPGKKLA